MSGFRKKIVIGFSIFVFFATVAGIYSAIHSPLFVLQVVEVADQPEEAPLDAAAVTALAAVPVGEVNLFDLDLKAVERRILRNSWVREVRLQKRFPQTLEVAVRYREPKALLQGERGALSYVDEEGKIFGEINLMYRPDLPVLSGLSADEKERILDALNLIALWEKAPIDQKSQLASLIWDQERGFRALVSYPFISKKGAVSGTGRTWVDIGHDSGAALEAELRRLAQVFDYLGTHSIAARQIWADSGKKIVVKTTRGS